MKITDDNKRICPICGQRYIGRPALSRRDNETPICPDCGTREALEYVGVSKEEQEKILRTIHEHMRRGASDGTTGKDIRDHF